MSQTQKTSKSSSITDAPRWVKVSGIIVVVLVTLVIALHLTGKTIPILPGGQKLDCASCHQPDAAGIYVRRINFESHCQVCHSLQFDPETPGLTLPHGDADFVRAQTGFVIGGVAPLAHEVPPIALMDEDLFRYAAIWPAAGHPNSMFRISPQDLARVTCARVTDVAQRKTP